MTHPFFQGEPTPRIFAHRGLVPPDAAEVAENSIVAFASAHAAGVTYIETDCRLSADGVPILWHDATLERVTGDPRPISAVTTRELEALLADHGGLATLEGALDSFPTVRFNVDVKSDDVAAPAGRAVAPHAARVLVTSFDDRRRRVAWEAAQAAGGEPATSAGAGTIARVLVAVRARSNRWVARALRGIDALQVPERERGIRIVTPRLIEAARRAGVETHVWTVNEPDDMNRLLDLGVDGLVTDHADVALAVLKARKSGRSH